MDPVANLREDGWAYERKPWTTQRSDLYTSLAHSCGPLSDYEAKYEVVPRNNLRTTWDLTPDDPFLHAGHPIRWPGDRTRPIN